MTNPFQPQEGNFSLQPQPINAIEAISRAEIDVQIATAKRYPRVLTQVKQDMLEMATIDEETAAACFYSVPRGNKNIVGPSIRLAEIAFSCYGNVSAGARVVEVVSDGPHPYVSVQSICRDLQKNNAVSFEKRRRITAKKSNQGRIDDDDIQLAANAGASIAFRDAMFKIVPGILIKPVFEAARKVAIGDARTLSDRRQRAIDAFSKMGVSADRVLAAVDKANIEEVGLDDLGTLIGMFNAIREGAATIDDTFPPVSKPQPKKAEKPDFGEQPGGQPDAKQPGPEPSKPATAPKPEKKAKPAAKEEKPTNEPRETKETPQDRLFAALSEHQIEEPDFIAGLKLIKSKGVPDDVEVVHELADDLCEKILSVGLSQTMEEIRDARWLEEQK
jgi:hypothetical protein